MKSPGEAELERVIELGLERMYDEEVPDHVCIAYVLNPSAHANGPAFARLNRDLDERMRALADAQGHLAPALIGRFVALTEDDAVFGWMMFDGESERVDIRTVAYTRCPTSSTV